MVYINILQGKNGIVLHISSKIGQVEPETAALGPLEVPAEPRAAAVEHVAAPVEPVVAPVDKGSSPSEDPETLFFFRGLSFSPSGATTLPHINYAWRRIFLLNIEENILDG